MQRREGDGNHWEWVPASSAWSEDDMVAVALDVTATAEAFRPGSRLLGAFTTPTMPRTLAFEAEMTVATGTSFDGYRQFSRKSIPWHVRRGWRPIHR